MVRRRSQVATVVPRVLVIIEAAAEARWHLLLLVEGVAAMNATATTAERRGRQVLDHVSGVARPVVARCDEGWCLHEGVGLRHAVSEGRVSGA